MTKKIKISKDEVIKMIKEEYFRKITEIKLKNILNNLYPNEWEFVGDGKMVLGGKIPDFVNVNGNNQIIELYGRYWHRNDNPQDRIDLFQTFGYATMIVFDNELKDEQIKAYVREVEGKQL